jgi:hypothetical protein
MNPQESSSLMRHSGIEDRDARIEVFVICEGATEQDGRLSLIGAYEVIGVPAFPCVSPVITVVLRLRFWPAEGRHHLVRVEMTNPDGACVVRVGETPITLNPLNPERSIAYNLIGHFKDVRFDEPGEYTVDFYLNGRIEGRLPFCVVSNRAGSEGVR